MYKQIGCLAGYTALLAAKHRSVLCVYTNRMPGRAGSVAGWLAARVSGQAGSIAGWLVDHTTPYLPLFCGLQPATWHPTCFAACDLRGGANVYIDIDMKHVVRHFAEDT